MKGLNVHSEIGALKRVMVHRPGKDLVNLKPEDFEKVWIHDAFYLEYAQKEHDAFTQLLRDNGAEVLYMERMCAEAFDADPTVRPAFTEKFLGEANIANAALRTAVKERLDSIEDNYEFVLAAMGGYHFRDLDVPRTGSLALLDSEDAKPDDIVVCPLPSSYFSRDPLAVVGRGATMNKMYWPQRNREVIFYETILRHHPDYAGTPIWYDHDSKWHIEGGDVLNINAKTLAIGLSQRTEASAIEQLARNLFWGEGESEIEQVYAIKIPYGYAYMHLDTVCTQIDVDKFTVYPGIFETLRVYRLTKGATQGEVNIQEMDDTLQHILEQATGVDHVQLIECGAGDPIEASREQWNDGSNTLALAPGKVCVYERNTVTNDALYKAGVELVVAPSEELSRGRGGPRCMTMPFERVDL